MPATNRPVGPSKKAGLSELQSAPRATTSTADPEPSAPDHLQSPDHSSARNLTEVRTCSLIIPYEMGGVQAFFTDNPKIGRFRRVFRRSVGGLSRPCNHGATTHTLSPMPRDALPLAALSVLILLSGCVVADNDRHTIGRSVPVEAVTPGAAGRDGPLPADGPSLAGLGREHWQRTEYLVPIDGTYHAPHYTFAHPTRLDEDRQRGITPSPASALNLGASNGGQAGELLAAPVVAAAELLAMVPRMFFEWPWVAQHSPSQRPYQRTRHESAPADPLDEVQP